MLLYVRNDSNVKPVSPTQGEDDTTQGATYRNGGQPQAKK